MKIKSKQPITNRTDFFYYAFRNILFVSLPLVFVCSLVLSHLSIHSSATTSASDSDSISFTVSTSCTISSSLVSPHHININGGQYATDIGDTKVNAYCNDNNGYSIYAIGSSGGVDGNTDLINPNLSDAYNVHTGIHDSGNVTSSTPSSWSMKLTAGSGTGIDPNTGNSINTTPPTIVNGYNNYNIVPDNYTLVASRTSGTNMTTNTSATGSYFNTTYAIYITSVQPAGTYTGKVKYVMVHPNNSAQTTIPDLKAAFAAAGKQPAYQDENGYYYAMQDMTTDICNSVTRTGEITATQLVDRRDNKLYWVAKLADDKCWMTQNLDLDIGGANTSALTSENTDLSTTASGSGIYTTGYNVNDGVYTWTPDAKAVTSSHTISGTSVPDWPNSQTVPYSAEAGDAYYYTSGTTDPETKTTLAQCIANGHTEAECKHYHAGNYYNWTAAIASNNSSSFSTNFNQASNSICPKGWRLPVVSNSNQSVFEFGDLMYTHYHITTVRRGTNIWDKISYTSDGFNNLRKAPLWFVRSGYINDNTLNYSGVNGYYWSSTVSGVKGAYDLVVYNDGLAPAGDYNRYSGFPVRCIAR